MVERSSPDIAKLADELVEAVPSKGGYILVSAESRDEIVAALRARSSAGNVTVPVDAIVNLVNHQHQCDMDGVMVQVSRQALCEVLAYVTEVRLDNKWADGVAQPSPARADEDQVKDLILKHCTVNEQKVLLRTVCKDGIDIDRPRTCIMNIADGLLALAISSTDRQNMVASDPSPEKIDPKPEPLL